MSLKSDVAFERTYDELIKWAEATGQKLYTWWITTSEDMPDSWVSYRWGALLEELKNEFQHDEFGFEGVRVLERQPGTGRPHFHCVINKRIDGKRFAKQCKKMGLGRVSFRDLDKRYVAWTRKYLREYLTKDAFYGGDSRMRRWSTIGAARWAVRKCDVVITNEYTKFTARVRRELYNNQPVPNWVVRAIYQSEHVGYKEREDYVIWYFRDALQKGSQDLFAPLGWATWLIQQECYNWGRDESMDGRVPF